MAVRVVWHGVGEWEGALTGLEERVAGASTEGITAAGQEVKLAIAARAPRLTGALAGSIEAVSVAAGAQAAVEVGPTIIYGRRMELGYGGRHRYVAPAVEVAAPSVPQTVAQAWATALAG